MENLKTFEDCLLAINETIENFTNRTQFDSIKEKAFKKLLVIQKAISKDFIPNWSNHDEYKYFPYFYNNISGSGLVFHSSTYFCSFADEQVGFYRTRGESNYAGKQFFNEYKEFIEN